MRAPGREHRTGRELPGCGRHLLPASVTTGGRFGEGAPTLVTRSHGGCHMPGSKALRGREGLPSHVTTITPSPGTLGMGRPSFKGTATRPKMGS